MVMSARFLPFVAGSLFTAAVVLVGVGVSQAQQAAPLPPVAPQAAVVAAAPQPVPAVPAAAPRAPTPMFQPEQALDTSGGPTMMPAAPPARSALRSKVRTPDDETLPKWVPKRGRLTVVESSDLAENLGLVPRGTTKKSAERISAQDKLEEEAQARAAKGGAEPSSGFAFSVKSHIKNHR